MDINYFDEYLELAQCLNFTQAAKNLSMTQSALSKHITALEREFGCELFDRNRQKVTLTQVGKIFYDKAYVISQTYSSAKQETAKLVKKPPIRIGGLLQNQEVINLLSQTFELSNYPNVNMVPTIGNRSALTKIQEREIDLCILPNDPGIADDSSMISEMLYNDRFIVLVSNQHHLAQKEILSMADLKDEVFLHLINDYNESVWRCIEAVCERAGYKPKTQPHYIDSFMEYMTVAVEDTVYMVPETSMLSNALRLKSSVVRIPVIDDYAAFQIRAIYLKENQTKLESFLVNLREAASSMMQKVRSSQASGRPFKMRCNIVSEKYSLSKDEGDVLVLYAKGHSLGRIANELIKSEDAIQANLQQIFQKIGVTTREEIIELIDT